MARGQWAGQPETYCSWRLDYQSLRNFVKRVGRPAVLASDDSRREFDYSALPSDDEMAVLATDADLISTASAVDRGRVGDMKVGNHFPLSHDGRQSGAASWRAKYSRKSWHVLQYLGWGGLWLEMYSQCSSSNSSANLSMRLPSVTLRRLLHQDKHQDAPATSPALALFVRRPVFLHRSGAVGKLAPVRRRAGSAGALIQHR